jgi:hypothetical protein
VDPGPAAARPPAYARAGRRHPSSGRLIGAGSAATTRP